MNKVILKKHLIVGMMSALMLCMFLGTTHFGSLTVSAVDVDNDYLHEDVLGVPSFNEANLQDYISHYDNSEKEMLTLAPMDSEYSYGIACDLSESIYFPLIGYQLGGSCTSWATTYYQFTYEANRLNNVNTKENNNLSYSPVWTYNFLNGGEDGGAFIYEAYNLLREHGALKLTDCGLDDPLYTWSNKTDKMIEALNTRVVDDGVIWVYSNRASENLDEVKQALYGTDGTDGKVLTFSSCNRWTTDKGENLTTGEMVEVAYRCHTGGAHSMTVVGYNDNIWVDINGNGIVENCEKGAFKVANSWGTGGINQGYLWVSYDALNADTLVSGDWESGLPTGRVPAFQYSNPNLENSVRAYLESNYPDYTEQIYNDYVNRYINSNALYWIDVANKTPMYIGQLHVETNKRNTLEFFAGRNSLNDTSSETVQKFWKQGNINGEYSYDGTLVFDYDDLADPIGDYISGYNWFIRLNGNHNNASFKITDNLSNTIVDFGSISTGDSYMPISLSMGDLNYDGVVNSIDTEILYNARNNDTALSNLQEYLATNMDVPIQDYTVDYIVAADWGTGRNIQITITNTGDVAIRNWALQCSNFEGDISNPWNCTLLGANIIKNAMYNSDIAVGQSVTFGYTLTDATGEIPVFSLCTFRSVKQNGYDVSLDVTSEWDSGFIGNITITNTTNEPIMAWELSFTAVDFTITGGGQFEILENSGNNYTITGTYNGNIPIPANTSITMQFNGTKNGTPALSNVSMTEMVIEN